MSRVHRIAPMLHGHTRVEFEDGSSLVLVRGTLKKLPEIGDYYPAREVERAVDAKASEETLIERESVDERAESEDEERAAREPEARPRKKR